MDQQLARKRRGPSEQQNGAKCAGTHPYVPVEVQMRKRRTECEVKPKKFGSLSESLSSSLEGLTGSRKRKAKCEAEVIPKKAKVEGCKSSPEDELYDVTYLVITSRADFLSKYLEMYNLGSGNFGSVFAGVRMHDFFPVAIKHIPRDDVYYKKVVQNGVEYNLIDEVALMVKVAQGPCAAVVRMLDCYELPEEVILVMERPYPALNLLQYKKAQGGVLKEEEAKVILKQMVEASIQMHNSGVFHRDFKLENILVEMDHGVPKTRVIDFGCGCLVKEGTYDYYAGTFALAPPEWYSSKAYRAEPTTVYHLGTLLYDLLHRKSFNTLSYLRRKRRVKIGLSKECLDFLRCCLAPEPVKRASFMALQSHPWLP